MAYFCATINRLSTCLCSHLPKALKNCIFQPHKESEFAGDARNAAADVDGADIKPDNKHHGEAENGHIPINEEHNENFDSRLWRMGINLISIRNDNSKIHPQDGGPSVAEARIPILRFLRNRLSNWMDRLVVRIRAFLVGAVGRITDDHFVMVGLIAAIRQVFVTDAVGEELVKVVLLIIRRGSITSGLVQRRLCLDAVPLLPLRLDVECLSKREIRIVDAGCN